MLLKTSSFLLYFIHFVQLFSLFVSSICLYERVRYPWKFQSFLLKLHSIFPLYNRRQYGDSNRHTYKHQYLHIRVQENYEWINGIQK